MMGSQTQTYRKRVYAGGLPIDGKIMLSLITHPAVTTLIYHIQSGGEIMNS